MSVYNLLEYSKNYRKTTGSLWNYYRDEPTSNGEINHYLRPKSFDFKSSIVGEFGAINSDNQASKDEFRFDVPLKHLSNFWRSLKMPLINWEIELNLFWFKNCVILSNATRDAIAATEVSGANDSNVNPAVNVSATSATFKITNTNLYVPIVTLSTEDDNKFLEQLKSGFKRTIKWNKYRS